jgi:hypothetical protein
MRFPIALLLAAVPLAGCMSDDAPAPMVFKPRPEPCEVHLTGSPVFVRFAGDRSAKNCESWTSRRADGRKVWSAKRGVDGDERFRRVCVVSEGHTAAGLYAAGGIAPLERARQVCGTLLDRGWRELGAPTNTPEFADQANEQPPPDRFSPVRCAEGRCRQRGRLVARPKLRAACGEGRWAFRLDAVAGVGVYRCRP